MLQEKAHELSKQECELQAATSPGSPSGGAAPRAMTCQRSPLVTLYAEIANLPMWQDMTVHCGIRLVCHPSLGMHVRCASIPGGQWAMHILCMAHRVPGCLPGAMVGQSVTLGKLAMRRTDF